MKDITKVKALIVSEDNLDYVLRVFNDCVERFNIPSGAIRLYVEETTGHMVTELVKPHYSDTFSRFKSKFDRRVHSNGSGRGLLYEMEDGSVVPLDVVPSKKLVDMVRSHQEKKKDL